MYSLDNPYNKTISTDNLGDCITDPRGIEDLNL